MRKHKLILSGILAIGVLIAPLQALADHHGEDHASHHAKMDHKTLVNHFYDVVMTQHKLEMAEHFMAADAIEHEQIKGTYNAVAPHPVNNKELSLSIAKVMRGKFFIPIHVPGFVLKIMLGEMSIEVLKSTTVNSKKIQLAGFKYAYATIENAVENLLRK